MIDIDSRRQAIQKTAFAVLAATGISLSGCGDQINLNTLATEVAACSATQEKQDVFNIMREWYLWNDEAEQTDKYRSLNLGNFSDGNDLLDYLRYRPNQYDRGLSFISTPEADDTLFEAGQYIGFGISLKQGAGPDVILISQVFPGSPADDAGIERGFQLLTVNGRSIAEINAEEGLSAALGPEEEGFAATMQFADRNGTPLTPVDLEKAVITIDPVPLVSIIRDALNNPIAGYLVFTTFISTADSQLRNAFATFAAAGVDELIVDLRYNGGGLISTAITLGSLLAGPGNVGNVFTTLEYNSDHSDENFAINFVTEANAMTLTRVVFLTTDESASASELLINGLEPYFTGADEVVLIGETTFGKPVGQAAFDFCNEQLRLRPITFRTVNVAGDTDYFDGLSTDCPAGDDLTELLGDPDEAMLANAISYIENDTCPSPVITSASTGRKSGSKASALRATTTAQQLMNAY